MATFALLPNPYFFDSFHVRICGEDVAIPHRIHHSMRSIGTWWMGLQQKELLNCLLTRHSDGFVRQRHLTQIIRANHLWVAPFVIQLLGEYVVQIIEVIENNLESLDNGVYGQFLKENLAFFELTTKRVESYWDCYYRSTKRERYSGFKVLNYFQKLL